MKIFSLLVIFILSVLLSSCHTHRSSMVGSEIDTMAIIPMDTVALGYISPLNNVTLQMNLYYKEVNFLGFSDWEQWNLNIRTDSMIELRANNTNYIFETTPPAIAQDANVLHYSCTNAQKESMGVTIRKQPACEDEKGGVDYPFAVIILLKKADGTEITYSGCGFYLANPILNDIWALDSIKGKAIDRAAYANGVPSLEFHLDGMKIYGFAGCNQINGSFYIDRNDQLIFSSMKVTLMACESMEGEMNFLNAVNNKRYTYSLGNRRLTLRQKDGTLLVFKKVD